jgi:hypothetical protein
VGKFEDSVTAWRGQPFPPGSSNEQLDELHADLAVADTWVAESVIPLVERGVFQLPRVDVIEELRELNKRAVKLGKVTVGEESLLAGSYRDYAALLSRVYQEFLTRGQSEK